MDADRATMVEKRRLAASPGIRAKTAAGPTIQRRRPMEMLRKARTTDGSNCVPALAASSRRASLGGIEDVSRYSDLADVVEQGGPAQAVALLLVEPELLAEQFGVGPNPFTVTTRAAIVGRQPGGQREDRSACFRRSLVGGVGRIA